MKARRKFIRRVGGITAMLALGATGRASDRNHWRTMAGNQKKLEGGFIHIENASSLWKRVQVYDSEMNLLN